MTPDPNATAEVHGLGVFLASGDMIRPPSAIADDLLACGASWCPVLIRSIDGRVQPHARVAAVVAELRARDITPWLYAFPAPKDARAGGRHLRETAEALALERYCCIDIEPFKVGKHLDDWTDPKLELLFAALGPIRPTITLFTRAQWKGLAWDEHAPGAAIWLQVYERVANVALLNDAIARWPGRLVVPLVGTYLGDRKRLASDLANVSAAARAADAAGVWSLKTTSAAEARELRDWTLAAFAPPR